MYKTVNTSTYVSLAVSKAANHRHSSYSLEAKVNYVSKVRAIAVALNKI